MILHILKASAEDYNEMTNICVQSKKHWGYSEFLIDLWKDELTITPRFIRNTNVIKIENELGVILGFGSIEINDAKKYYQITHLWVLPLYFEKNIGKLLLEQLELLVENYKTIMVVSDPNSLNFYHKYGYQKIGEEKSKPDGKNLPVLKKIIWKNRVLYPQ